MIINPYAFGGGGGGGDAPNWSNVVSLLNFGGSDGSTTFVDERSKTWLAAGAAQIDTSLGYNAGKFGAGASIYSADSSDWHFGTGDFCIDAIIHLSSNVNLSFFANFQNGSFGGGSTGSNGVALGTDSSGKLKCSLAGVGDTVFGVSALATGTDVHIEWSRIAGESYLFIDGVLDKHQTDTNNYSPSSGAPNAYVSGYYANPSISSAVDGWLRAIRVTKGAGWHTSGFTPPTAPFPTS